MKTPIIVFVISLLLVSIVRADDATYTNIIKERESILSQLLATQEQRYASGSGSENDVTLARLALFSFRRDTATSVADKIKQQEAIVGASEKQLKSMERRWKAGTTTKEQVLLATDLMLQSKQVLEELRQIEKPKNPPLKNNHIK